MPGPGEYGTTHICQKGCTVALCGFIITYMALAPLLRWSTLVVLLAGGVR